MKTLARVVRPLPIIVTLGIGLVAYQIITSRSERVAQEAARAKRVEETDRAVRELTSRFDADDEWVDELEDRWRTSEVYTIDLHDFLLSDEGRPVLVRLELVDVVRQGGTILGVFAHTFLGPDISFVLELDGQVASRLRRMASPYLAELAGVAVIDSVGRWREWEMYDRTMWARGALLDFVRVQ